MWFLLHTHDYYSWQLNMHIIKGEVEYEDFAK